MTLSILFLYKLTLASTVVVALSLVAEHVSPKWAGLLSGLPTGSAITLYFYGLEHGVEFAGHSAIFNMLGLIAMQAFLFGYYIGGRHISHHKIVSAIGGGLCAYLITTYALSWLDTGVWVAILLPAASFLLFSRLFAHIPQTEIDRAIRTTPATIALRAIVAAIIISFVTSIAHIVGPAWAGLFSAFPSTLFPLLLIIHWSYGERLAFATLKHVPAGLGGLLTYSLILYLGYPTLELHAGIAVAMCGALLYLLIYRFVDRKLADN